jgi:hypothetical protein
MITKEREIGEANFVRSKNLRLISPEWARKLGIPAEGPVFVSPYIREAKKCGCGTEYKPLIYQVGRNPVKAHHFHGPDSGGIYYDNSVEEDAPVTTMYGFVAVLEPVGRKFETSWDGNSEAVLVKQIRVFCEGHRVSGFGFGAYEEELKEGVVVGDSEDDASLLIPLCNQFLEEDRRILRELRIRYNFKITEEGDVLFSEIKGGDRWLRE